MDLYQQYIHISRYSRWREDLGRRETWEETVQRYVDFFDKRTEGKFSDVLQGEVKPAILNLEVMPSMRALMTAGEALERENLAGFNCFGRDVKFMTKDGDKTFGETVGTTQKVLAGDGVWRDAEVRSFGKQKLQTVVLRPGSRSRTSLRIEIEVTPNHRWITGRGEVTDLQVGDVIPFNGPDAEAFNAEDFIRGLGFGDGTIDSKGNARIRLCGKKAKYLDVIEQYGHCSVMHPPSNDGDPLVVFHKGHFADWKKVPESVSYWWLHGYIAADGHMNGVKPGMSTQDADAAEYVVRNSAYSGLAVTGSNSLDNETNYGKRSAPLIRIGLREEIEFRVMEIRDAGEDEVFCVTEPVTGMFTLARGVLTGNCSYLAINSKRSFAEALYILMCGTGVGFSCERQEIAKLPAVPDELTATDDTIVVADSKEGWAKAYYSLLNHLWVGDVPKVDYSKVRAAGARLKVFGGRASGPDPLRKLFNFTIETFKKARGRKLNSFEVHNLMCMVGEIVVVGGVRRSALISLSNLSDQRMRDAKSGQWWVDNPQLALANNSVAYTEKPSAEIFTEEWLALVKSKSGERGIFNREAAQKQAAKWGRRKADLSYGCNPCCVTGDTLILTDCGNVRIDAFVGVPVKVWNGKQFSEVVPFSVGEHDTLRVDLSNGVSITCTKNHKFIVGKSFDRVQAEDLKIGDKLSKFDMPVIQFPTVSDPSVDAYSQGFYSGDGNTDLSHSWVYEPKYQCIPRLAGEFGDEHESVRRVTWRHGEMLGKEFVPAKASVQYRLNWLAGLLDSDGSVTRDKNGNGLQIASTNKAFLSSVRLMLVTLGVQAKIVSMHPERVASMPDGKGGRKAYSCKAVHRLLIGNMDTFNLVNLGLVCNRLEIHGNQPQRSAQRFVTVLSITPVGKAEHFCFDEPVNHTGTFNGVVTGQSEIILRDKQLCNLSEVIIREDDDETSLLRKVRLATILGTLQATLTDFKFVSETWIKNTAEEALLGVSLTGIMDNKLTAGVLGNDVLVPVLNRMRDHARETNTEWAEKLGINPSAAITCVKPSGTVSQLCNTASGIHPRYNRNYIRTVRVDKKDPLYTFMLIKGFPIEDDVMRPESTAVVSFAMSAPDSAITTDQVSAIDALEHWLLYQREWCHHKPSVTINVGEDEWVKVGAWVYEHFDEVSGVSFLPRSEHTYQQAPYQNLTREEFDQWNANNPVPEVDWRDLSDLEKTDNTAGVQTLACVSGACELPGT